MAIVDVRVIPLAVPLARSFAAAGDRGLTDSVPHLDRLLVAVETDSGLVGWGEGAPFPTWPRGLNRRAMQAIIEDEYRPLLLGRDPRRLGELIADLEKAVADAPFPLAAVDMALWDLLGQILHMPLYQLLGGLARPSLPLHYSIGLKEPAAVAEEARTAWDQGYRDFKLKVGGPDWEAEEAALAAVREALGDGARIRVDANGAWTVPQAITRINRLNRYGLDLVEQPVAAGDLAGMAAVRRAVGVPIMADESCFNAADVARIARLGAADAVNIKLAKCGGLWNARKMAHVAEAMGLACFMGGMLELELGASAGFQFALSQRVITYSTGILNMFTQEPLAEPAWEVRGPHAFPRPGIVGIGARLHGPTIQAFTVLP